jgi:phage protein U
MPNEVMLQLGSFQFSVRTAVYQELRRTKNYRWAGHDRIGVRPAHQFIGPGDESVALSGVIYPGEFGGADQVRKMRETADKGEALQMVAARDASSGDVLGLWVILSVSEKDTVFFAGGQPRKIEFDMVIVHYGDDQDSSGAGSSFAASNDSDLGGFIDRFFG